MVSYTQEREKEREHRAKQLILEKYVMLAPSQPICCESLPPQQISGVKGNKLRVFMSRPLLRYTQVLQDQSLRNCTNTPNQTWSIIYTQTNLLKKQKPWPQPVTASEDFLNVLWKQAYQILYFWLNRNVKMFHPCYITFYAGVISKNLKKAATLHTL